ncbi:MAG: hypothetical protein CL868_15390 [Cytophagaceae bacterium]|nr:hypothetical protein [Cytophagaceae bacterium]
MNTQTKNLVELLDACEDLATAREKFNSRFSFDLDQEEFDDFINERLSFTGLLEGEVFEQRQSKSFIKFEFTLLPKKVAALVARPFEGLFLEKFFWPTFIILFLLAVWTLFYNVPEERSISILLFFILYLPTVFLHELGHVAACRRFTGKNGEIGAGLYILFPVFFSNIKAMWMTTKKNRVIANLAGVYMQLWCMLLCLLGSYIFGFANILVELCYILALMSVFQLLPFIRSDGYWLLSDLTSTPNLLSKSKETFKNSFARPRAFFVKKGMGKRIFLWIYGVFNTLFIFYFVGVQLVFNWQHIFEFPSRLISNLLHLDFDFSIRDLSVVIFYMIVFKYAKRLIRPMLNKKIEKKG